MNQAGAPVLLAIEGGVATVTLNRPDVLNALDAGMARALDETLARIAEDAHVRAVLLRGAGRAFCAGGDVSRFLEGDPAAVNRDPYAEGWMIALRVTSPSDLGGLLSSADYRSHIGE